GWEGEEGEGEEVKVRFDVEVDAWEGEGELWLYWLYNRDLYDGWRIEQMGRHYQRVLEAVVAEADREIGLIDLLGRAERRQILEEWNETETDYPEERGVDEVFEEQGRRSPEGVALS